MKTEPWRRYFTCHPPPNISKRTILLALLFLAARGRPLTEAERAFAFSIHGDTLD
jgi:hypothetical protein